MRHKQRAKETEQKQRDKKNTSTGDKQKQRQSNETYNIAKEIDNKHAKEAYSNKQRGHYKNRSTGASKQKAYKQTIYTETDRPNKSDIHKSKRK